MIRVGWVVAGAVAVAGVLGGCTDPAAGSSAAPTAPATASAAQRAQWALPLDPYIYTRAEMDMTSYAENLLVSQCMAAEHLDWPIPAIDIDHLTTAWESPSGRRILTVEVARTYGYHTPSPLAPDVVARMSEMNTRQLSQAEQAALDACIQTARQTLPPPEINQVGALYANDAYDEAGQRPEVVAAGAAWRQCMAALGISDLPELPEAGSPSSMPSTSQRQAFHLDDAESEPSAAEIAAAVTDAQCRESSGFADALYDALWALQGATLKEHADELVRERDTVDTYLDAARRVIAERTGS